MTPETLDTLQAARAARRPVALLTRLLDGAQRLHPDEPLPPALAEAAEASLRDDRAGPVTAGGETWFIQPQAPPPRLIVVGAVHVAQALVPSRDRPALRRATRRWLRLGWKSLTRMRADMQATQLSQLGR